MRILTWFFLIISIVLINAGQLEYEYYQKNNITNETISTLTTLEWNSSKYQPISISDLNYTRNYTELRSIRINNMILKLIDWIGYSSFEMVGLLFEFGYSNPEITLKNTVDYLPTFLRWVLVVLVLWVLSKLLLPLIAAIYLISSGIKNLINKHKEKKQNAKHNNNNKK